MAFQYVVRLVTARALDLRSALPQPTPHPMSHPRVDSPMPRQPRRFASVLPWLVSLGLHSLLVVAALFAIWTSVAGVSPQIVPLVQLGNTAGTPLQRQAENRLEAAAPPLVPAVEPAPQENTLDAPIEITTPLLGTLDMAGKPSPFQSTLTSSAQFQTTFLGSGGNARRIAFVIDASGSLLDTLPFVLQELQKTVDSLHPRQEFTVLFYQGDTIIEAPPAGLKQAIASHKQQLAHWLDPQKRNIFAGGASDPVPAIKRALSYQPQLIFLLSDNITAGDLYQIDQRRLLDEITAANTSGTRINTLQFLYADARTGPEQKETLELIAEQSGGVYRFIGSNELGLQEGQQP